MEGGGESQVSNHRGSGGTAVDGIQIQHNRRLLDFLQSVNLKYVKLGYHYLISNLLTLCLILVMIVILIEASQTNPDDIRQLWLHLKYNLVSVIICSTILVFRSIVYIMTHPRPVYLVDYSCYRAPDNLKAPYSQFIEHSRLIGDFDELFLEFQSKILECSGLGEETYVPDDMHYVPPRLSMAAARNEGPSRSCLGPWTLCLLILLSNPRILVFLL